MFRIHRFAPIVAALLFIAWLTACSGGEPATETELPSPIPLPTWTDVAAQTAEASSPTPVLATPVPPSESPTLAATVTASVVASQTPQPSPSSSATPAPAVSPTATLFALSIDAMRQGVYPGSEIAVDEELTPAPSKYRRFYVYYLSQGLKIYALLAVPDGSVPDGGWPAILLLHGDTPPKEYRTPESYTSTIDRLANSGYLVFAIDYRGYGHSEGDPQGAYSDTGYEADVLNAIATLKRQAPINPAKIGVWAHNMGGFLALRTMVISKDVKAAEIWSGVVGSYQDLLENWPAGPGTPPEHARDWLTDWPTEFGSPETNPAFWGAISANSYLSDLSGPLQLQIGLADEQVPPQFSITLAQQVEAVGGQVELVSYVGDDDNLTANFTTAMDRSVAFFDKYVK